MKRFFGITSTLLIFLSFGCQVREPSHRDSKTTSSQEYLIHSTLYAQSAAEYKALCYQAYTLAQKQLIIVLAEGKTLRPAVILDLDETVLDNSPYTAWQIESGKPYEPATWSDWVEAAEAQAVPGAVEFLQWADSSEVEIFYISNRSADGLAATIENLQNLNIPQADSASIFLKTETSDKSARRDKVKETGVNVVMYIGDNLGDYSEIWDKPANPDDRLDSLTAYRDKIGVEFIVLPNSLYGTWEGAVYNYNREWTDTQRDSLRKSRLKPWKGVY